MGAGCWRVRPLANLFILPFPRLVGPHEKVSLSDQLFNTRTESSVCIEAKNRG